MDIKRKVTKLTVFGNAFDENRLQATAQFGGRNLSVPRQTKKQHNSIAHSKGSKLPLLKPPASKHRALSIGHQFGEGILLSQYIKKGPVCSEIFTEKQQILLPDQKMEFTISLESSPRVMLLRSKHQLNERKLPGRYRQKMHLSQRMAREAKGRGRQLPRVYKKS